MPVTKKRGAIFAIYADSPQHGVSVAQKNGPTPSQLSSSPTKRLSQPRKALASLQPTAKLVSASAMKGKPSEGKAELGKPRQMTKATAPAVESLSSTQACLTAPSTSGSKRIVKSGSKRSIEVFADSPKSSSIHLPLVSPAKKTRSSPRKVTDKENVEPGSDSPAGRTRSKTRVYPGPHENETPVKERSRRVLGEKGERIERISGLSSKSGNLESLSGLGEMGLGKGLGVKRTIKVLGEKRGLSAGAAMPMSGKTLDRGDSAKGLKKGRSITVFADDVLCDVSEAYGAVADEPVGFKTQRA